MEWPLSHSLGGIFLLVPPLTRCYSKLHELVEEENYETCAQNITDDEVDDVLSGVVPRESSEGNTL